MTDTQLLQDHLRGMHASDPNEDCRACRHQEPVSPSGSQAGQENNPARPALGTGRKCLCGCGRDVSPRARFKSGHDAKLKSRLVRLARADCKCLSSGNEHLASCVVNNARSRLEELGWAKFI